MMTGAWIALSGGISAIATVAMAIFTWKLCQVNNNLAKIAKTAEDTQNRRDQQQELAIRLSVDHRLRVVESLLRSGISNPRALIMLVSNHIWVEHPLEGDLAQVFNGAEIDVILRAFLAVERFAETVVSSTITLEKDVGPLGKLFPPTNLKKFQEQVKVLAEQTLPVVEEAQKTCRFRTSQDWARMLEQSKNVVTTQRPHK